MTDREKSHREALEDIAEQASDTDTVPDVAFAAFLYDERSDFTHTARDPPASREVIELLGTHVAALAEAGDVSVGAILSGVVEVAETKAREGHDAWQWEAGNE